MPATMPKKDTAAAASFCKTADTVQPSSADADDPLKVPVPKATLPSPKDSTHKKGGESISLPHPPLGIVPPHRGADHLQDLPQFEMVEQLERLDDFLWQPGTLKKLLTMPGVREIQMNRYEIFMQATGKQTDAMDWALKELSIDKQELVDFCISQSKRDPRTKHLTNFGNFSLIVNDEEVGNQYPHIDLLFPNFQFGLILTDQSPGTYVYKARPVETARDLQKQWNLSDRLVEIIDSSSEASTLLKHFGRVLSDNMERIWQPDYYPRGTLLCLPGGVVHAGPRSRPRSVVFFSGAPQVGLEYHPDTQYFDTLLLADLLQVVWNECSNKERQVLLFKLAELIYQSGVHNLSRHLNDNPIEAFCNKLPKTMNKKRVKRIISTFARETPEMKAVGYLDEHGTKLTEISAPRLYTEWENKVARVILYQTNEEVRLFYPEDSAWEGIGKKYQLVWNVADSGDALFDGTNGALLDDEGQEIVCFQRGSKRPPPVGTSDT